MEERDANVKAARTPNAKDLLSVNWRHLPPDDTIYTKTEPTIIACVDEIIYSLTRDILRYSSSILGINGINGKSDIALFTRDLRGWSKEDVAAELRNRLFHVYDLKNRLIVRYMYDFDM